MRRELRDSNTAGEDGAASESDANNLAQPLDAQALDGAINARGAGGEAGTGRARGATADRPATGKALPSNALQNRGAAERQAGASDPGVQRRLSVPPAQQSQQYKELQERFSRQQGGQPVTAEQANLNSRLLRNAQDAPADGAAQPGADQRAGRRSGRVVLPPPRGSGAPDAAPAPSTPAPAKPGASNPADAPAKTAPANTAPAKALPAAPAPERPAPLRIKSLAEGVEAEGLRDLLVSAEDLMREGKFTSAIDKYAQAEQVVPNNPLVRLGRAQAEIGATRYGSAERDLREAIAADPALLMGQYDLESFIGRDRLSFVIKDLKQIAATETTSPRPMLLLAYIAYGSTGQEAAASEFLDSAAERAGRPDPLIEAMRLHWSLPATGAAPATPNLNK